MKSEFKVERLTYLHAYILIYYKHKAAMDD